MILKPRTLLIVDALGAAITSAATFYLLAGQHIETGLPIGLLNAMAIVAACFACFDVVAIIRCTAPAIPLRIIALANFSYCILVFVSLCIYRNSVSYLGLAYFCIEISIVASLAVWEWIFASRRGHD